MQLRKDILWKQPVTREISVKTVENIRIIPGKTFARQLVARGFSKYYYFVVLQCLLVMTFINY